MKIPRPMMAAVGAVVLAAVVHPSHAGVDIGKGSFRVVFDDAGRGNVYYRGQAVFDRFKPIPYLRTEKYSAPETIPDEVQTVASSETDGTVVVTVRGGRPDYVTNDVTITLSERSVEIEMSFAAGPAVEPRFIAAGCRYYLAKDLLYGRRIKAVSAGGENQEAMLDDNAPHRILYSAAKFTVPGSEADLTLDFADGNNWYLQGLQSGYVTKEPHYLLFYELPDFKAGQARTWKQKLTISESANYAHEFTDTFPPYIDNWDDAKWDLLAGKHDAIYLNGWWKLVKLRGTEENPADDYGTTHGFSKSDFDDGDWMKYFVPWNWNTNDQFRGVGWYRRSFPVPDQCKGKRLILRFGQVLTEATVFINGELVGKHRPYFHNIDRADYAAFSMEITKFVKFEAENNIAVRVYHHSAEIRWDGGIWQPVLIDVVPTLFADNIRVTPQLDKQQIEVACRFDNGGPARTVKLTARLGPWTSARYQPAEKIEESSHELGSLDLPAGVTEKTFVVAIANPVFWTYERPNLYHLRLLAGEELIGQTRFGYRQHTIDGPRFLLNGKKLWIPGDQLESRGYAKVSNLWPFNQDLSKDDFSTNLAEWFGRYRNVNILLIRAHSDCWTEPMFDVADELGMLIYPELDHVTDNACIPHDAGGGAVHDEYKKLGRLPDGYKGQIRDRMYAHWNHPSVWALSLGNEMYSTDCTPFLCDMYDFLKHEVKVPFPVSQSGRYYSQLSDDAFTAKVDFYDDHYYSTWEDLWTDIETRSANLGTYLHGKLDKPWFDGECFGLFPNHHWDHFLRPLRPSLPDIPRDQYVKLCLRKPEEFQSPQREYWTRARENLRLYGIRGWLLETERGNPCRAEFYKREVETQRRWNQYVTGFATHRVNPTRVERMDTFGEAMKRINSPLYVCSDLYFRHHPMAGETLTTKVYTFNDTLGDVADLGVRVEFAGPDGRAVFAKDLRYDAIAQGEKRVEPVDWAVPGDAKTGRYHLKLTLVRAGKTLLENDYLAYVFGPDGRRNVFDTGGKKIALYVKPSDPLFKDTKYDSTATVGLFERLKIPAERLTDFAALDRYQILVIGVNSFGPELRTAGPAIRRWIEAGGKCLCLEQMDFLGPVPFAREYQVTETRAVSSDLIIPQHPIFAGLENEELDLWDGEDPIIVRKHIEPLSTSVLATSAYHGHFGMTAAEVRIGKGIVLFSQAEATLRYGRDAAATKYLENLLHYALETSWDESQTPRYQIPKITGTPIESCEIAPIDPARAVAVDLRGVANRGFTDEKGRDGEGGWFDEGSQDLRTLPVGRQVFEGVPFDILDPAANAGRSCVVLYTAGNTRFPRGNRPDRVEIPVGRPLRRIAFLVAGAWAGTDGSTAAELEFHFAGGQCLYESETLALREGVNFGNWWIDQGVMPQARLAWSASDPRIPSKIGLWMVEWTNRQPQAELRSIIFKTANSRAIPALVAATGETP